MPATNSHKKLQIITFLSIVLVMLVLVALMLKPLANILLFSGILTVIFYPLYKSLLKRFKSKNLASALTIFIVLFGLFIFVWLFGQLLYGELLNLYERFRSGEFIFNRDDVISQLPAFLQDSVRTLTADINSLLSRFTVNAFKTFSSLLSNLAEFFLNLFLVFFAFYYLLKDGGRLKQLVLEVSPISNNQENILLQKIIASINGVVKGTFFVGLIQSSIAFIGFLFLGVPNPLLWALCTFVAAFVPNIGTALVIVPAILYLVLTGHVPQAIGMGVFGVIAGLIDNFVSPKLVGQSAKLHPLLVLLSVIGGIQLFGFLGFLLGPIFMAVFVALVEMYTTDFKKYLEK